MTILVVMAVIFQIVASSYLTSGNVFDIIRRASLLIIISLGMAIVVAGGGIDLSVGHIAGFSALVTAILLKNVQADIYVAVSAGVLVGALLGAFNGLVISLLGISSFIATLGTQFIIVGMRYWISSGATIMGLLRPFRKIGNGEIFSIPYPVIIMVVVSLICFVIMERTVFGRRVSATGGNLEASRLSGINIRKYTALTFVLAGVLSSFSGIILTARQGLANVDIGDGFLLDALTIAVLSAVLFGKMKVMGVILVTILIVMLANGLTMVGVSPSAMNLVKGILLLVAIVLGKVINNLQPSK
ncbi:MAG: ABC transporter permease [Bacillota bacterium]